MVSVMRMESVRNQDYELAFSSCCYSENTQNHAKYMVQFVFGFLDWKVLLLFAQDLFSAENRGYKHRAEAFDCPSTKYFAVSFSYLHLLCCDLLGKEDLLKVQWLLQAIGLSSPFQPSIHKHAIGLHLYKSLNDAENRLEVQRMENKENATGVFCWLTNILLPFKRYKISNADLIPAVSFFKVGDYLFTWVLDYKKLVEPIQEEVCPCLPFTTTVCAFHDFSRHADAESYFDVKEIVIHAFPQKQVKPKSFQRDLVVIDESKIPIILTLWDDFAKEEGLLISSLFPATTIIIAHNVKATTFHGLSLSTRRYSYLMINPPLPDSLSLRGWREDNKDEIAAMLENKAYINPSFFFPPPAASDVITVTEAISLLPVRKTAWVIGKPNFKFTKYKLWSALCLNCNARLDIPVEWVFDCSNCGSPLGFELRSSVPFQLTDNANMLSVTIKTPDVQLLTKITPQQLRDSDEFGLGVQGDLKIALEKLTLVCFLRSKKKKKDDPEPNIVPYTSIKAYDAAAIGLIDGCTTPTTKTAIEDDASGATQIFSPERSASSKRNIADVSETSMLAHTGEALNQETATFSVVMESATAKSDAQSPSKKTKDKVKLN